MTVERVTVLICTYNRVERLRETLDALQDMSCPDNCDVEIVIVDNNSTDGTREAVQSAAEGARFPVRYLLETQQGKSFALNLGLAHSRGDVLALTDEDVLPAVDWLQRVVAAFRTYDVTFVFGKVLPRWSTTPPPELLTERAQHIWGPLALLDYGDAIAHYEPDSRGLGLPIGANLSFSRQAVITTGGWRTDLGKVNNTLISGEDHEIFMRLRRHHLYRGVYDPANQVRHYVPASRLTRAYFRRWFYWSGKTRALMLQDLYPELDIDRVLKLAGTPRFLFRQGFEETTRYVRALWQQDALGIFIEELALIQYLGLYAECWRRRHRTFNGPPAIGSAPAAGIQPSTTSPSPP